MLKLIIFSLSRFGPMRFDFTRLSASVYIHVAFLFFFDSSYEYFCSPYFHFNFVVIMLLRPNLNCATCFSSTTDVGNVFLKDEKSLWRSTSKLIASSSQRSSKSSCFFCYTTQIEKATPLLFFGIVVF